MPKRIDIPNNLVYIEIDIVWSSGPKFYAEGLMSKEKIDRMHTKLKDEHGIPLGYLNPRAPRLMHYANLDDIYMSNDTMKIKKYLDRNKITYITEYPIIEIENFLKEDITL